MPAPLILIALVALAGVAAVALFLLYRTSAAETALRARHDTLLRENLELTARLARAQAQCDAAEQSNRRFEQQLAAAHAQLKDSFANLAQAVLDEKSATFARQNASSLEQILAPLRDRIDAFQRKVDDAYAAESRERFAMKHELERLLAMNHQLSQDARNLTDALKGQSQLQGAWGELILERLLESAGLERGREFDVQLTVDDAELGRRRPDAVLRLPEGRDLVIDAKVSLVAYERYCSCEHAGDADAALKSHVASARAHMTGLAERSYESLAGLNTPDFTLMFVPIEGAFAALVRGDESLFQEAFQRKVLIVSPTTLLVVLKLVSFLWRQDKISRNTRAIIEQGRLVYEKFAGFLAEFDAAGRQLHAAAERYERARSRLTSGRGSLASKVEKLVALGVSPSQRIQPALVEAAGEPLPEDPDDARDGAA
ncbi:MAG TPA: DNA recombination protein RmuC [Burkholderiaceae bacterium]|nr:DNA recombination protein RmuC [Burkholderiaceae bacterium]